MGKMKVSRVTVISVLLRLGQLACGSIVMGLLAHFFNLIHDIGGDNKDPHGRLVFAAAIASVTILAALLCLPPYAYSFWAWPIDLFLAVAWLVVFSLLETLAGISTCRSAWYYDYWGYLWNWYSEYYYAGCSAWRAVLAFSFIPIVLYLLSALLGIRWTLKYGQLKTKMAGYMQRLRNRSHARTAGSAAPVGTATADAAVNGPQPSYEAHLKPATTVESPGPYPATPELPGNVTHWSQV